MKKTVKIEKVMIMQPSILICEGLHHLFKQKLPEVDIVRRASVYDMAFYDELYNVDLVVSELYGLNEDINIGTKLLSFIQSLRDDKPLLIMTDIPGRIALNYLDFIPEASFISLSEDIHQLTTLVDQVLAGKVIISPSLFNEKEAGTLNIDVAEFSRTEKKVYNLLREGLSISQIAKNNARSVKTVSAHKRNIMEKLGVNSEVELYACFNQ
jgi:two-component system capsular synthesis response regulator RcsB